MFCLQASKFTTSDLSISLGTFLVDLNQFIKQQKT